jgi:Mn2+/Fe2+ NRAMP family transporter
VLLLLIPVSSYIAVPMTAALLIGMTVTGNFQRWEPFMYVFIVTNFLAVPLAVMSHPTLGPIVHDTFVPRCRVG